MRLWAFACLFAAAAFASPGTGNVTFYKDVLPVLQQRCQECHRPGEAAPMSLLTYKDARPWAASIKEAVLTRKMPPWYADPAHGKFSNDRTLPARERDILVNWAGSGALEGNPRDAPKPLEFAEGWTIGKPDLVLEMPKQFMVPASGKVDYMNFVVPTRFTEDKWVESIEVRPGNRSVVHHIVLWAAPAGSPLARRAKPGEPVAEPDDPQQTHPPDTGVGLFFGLGGTREMIAVYVPGGMAYRTRPGQARLVKAGSDLIFQMHYTANGTAQADRSRVAFIFAKLPPKERVVNTFVANVNIHIPAGEANCREIAKVKVYEDVKLQSLFPHMHLRGKAFEYRAIYPTGESQVLLSVPHYDFNWQLTYDLAQPITLPKGTELEVTAWYDNSANNPFNPDPKKDVWWGQQTWEEMLAGFVDFVIPVNMNPRDVSRPTPQKVAKGE